MPQYPLQPVRAAGGLNSQTLHAAIMSSTVGVEYATVQLHYPEGSWPTSLVVAVEVTIDGSNWATALYIDPSTGLVASVPAFTAFSTKQLIMVSGATGLRLRVSTVSSAGHATIRGTIYSEASPARPIVSGIASSTVSSAFIPTGGGGSPPGSGTAPAPGSGSEV